MSPCLMCLQTIQPIMGWKNTVCIVKIRQMDVKALLGSVFTNRPVRTQHTAEITTPLYIFLPMFKEPSWKTHQHTLLWVT